MVLIRVALPKFSCVPNMQTIHPNQPIAIIGLGYVGLPLAVEFGKKRLVVGFDINVKRIAELQGGHDHTLETTSEELKAAVQLTFTSHLDDLRDCSVFIVTVPTPIDNANRPDLTPLIKASETVGKVMRQGAIVIFESTVYPGATEEVCVPVLEKHSGKKFNVDFFCGYSPERINPGDKINTLTKIKKITSGSTPAVADVVDALYNEIITAGTHKAASVKVAEAAKVIENTQRDLNIAFMNELSLIFQALNIDTGDVLAAARTKWNFMPFQPGLVGGHCIGVDPYYLTYRAERAGYHPEVILAGRRINDGMGQRVARECIRGLLRRKSNGGVVTILGLTFKEDVPDTRNSRVIDIIRELESFGLKVQVSDPMADPADAMHEYGVTLVDVDALQPADSIIMAVAHKNYIDAGWPLIQRLLIGGRGLVLDVKMRLDRGSLPDGIELWRL